MSNIESYEDYPDLLQTAKCSFLLYKLDTLIKLKDKIIDNVHNLPDEVADILFEEIHKCEDEIKELKDSQGE